MQPISIPVRHMKIDSFHPTESSNGTPNTERRRVSKHNHSAFQPYAKHCTPYTRHPANTRRSGDVDVREHLRVEELAIKLRLEMYTRVNGRICVGIASALAFGGKRGRGRGRGGAKKCVREGEGERG